MMTRRSNPITRRLSSLAWRQPRLIWLFRSKINAASNFKCKQTCKSLRWPNIVSSNAPLGVIHQAMTGGLNAVDGGTGTGATRLLGNIGVEIQ